jgi:hypothetical protein
MDSVAEFDPENRRSSRLGRTNLGRVSMFWYARRSVKPLRKVAGSNPVRPTKLIR